ncbi:gamma-glutamyl-gamma-aminobutyrate hydrolase family protein [Kitasatospora indigofera]|uniref:gamma-glutamyl-gamma-aminobutyrate hydrolase family protein n=1 Tax=Kitasatospora indigofera TaxID=67307 RepID=UPI00368C5E9C
MIRPVIGISTYLETSASWREWEMPAALLPLHYVRMVQVAGGAAVMLPPDEPPLAEAVIAGLDGLVIAGGPDVAPERYGAERDLRTGTAAVERDAWELALIAAALDLGTPLLGVCRGMQLINVVHGGTLVQHLDGHQADGMFAKHPVTPVEGTLYHSLVPETTAVATYHHQAVARLGAGLQASAHANDGTIEAIEGRGAQWVVGVQWHPEMGTDHRVAAGFIGAAAASCRPQQFVC